MTNTDDVTHLRALLAEQTTRAERAEAACAEMRAALEEAWKWAPGDWADRIAGILFHPDLGAGKVLVEREVVERVREVVGWYVWYVRHVDNKRDTLHGTREAATLLADLDALLKKGGG